MTEPFGCRLGGPDGRSGRTGNMLLRAAATVGLAFEHGTTPRFESEWPYKNVFSFPDEWFVPLAELGELQPVHELPEVAHIPEGYRHYLQDVSLWWDHRDAIGGFLQPSRMAMDAVNQAWLTVAPLPDPILAMHVRRGDNVTNEAGTINCLPADYYLEAMPFARHDVNALRDFASVLIVTDDADWCERHLAPFLRSFARDVRVLRGIPRPKEHEAEYLTETPRDWVDLFVLAGCSDVIPRPTQLVISNSTFAYMAAVIGGYDNPVRPSYWVGRQLTDQGIDPGLLFPAEWRNVIPVADPSDIDA